MTDNIAVQKKGYTRAIEASAEDLVLSLLVKPDADLDGAFQAWDTEEQEFIRVFGWLFIIEDS